MYCNLWNICKVMSNCFLNCSSNQGTFKKAKWQLDSICPSDVCKSKKLLGFLMKLSTHNQSSAIGSSRLPFPCPRSMCRSGASTTFKWSDLCCSISCIATSVCNNSYPRAKLAVTGTELPIPRIASCRASD